MSTLLTPEKVQRVERTPSRFETSVHVKLRSRTRQRWVRLGECPSTLYYTLLIQII